MGNRYFQEARDAVNEAAAAMAQTHTPLQQAAATEKIKRARQALSQAFADSTLAEREQLMDIQKSLYEISDEFLNEEL
ncbi:DUF3813 domain-containing protein [Evansella clarkii]|jgi:hypothetical protein|uniref:DUF3813 domain-containing protein n=1 Tax=Evansella clarkii TaxID=79879 RepID=UPI000996139F|nr:DUF3813 domain-containing protein [Evansella clarkii]